MRRALPPYVLLLTVLALPVAASEAPPAALQVPQGVECPAPAVVPSPLRPAPEASPEELLSAAGLVPSGPVAVDTLPSCPSVSSCPNGPNTSCRNSSCSSYDTGYSACQTGSSALSCQPGQTIHVRSCQCRTALQAYCCTHFPFCFCINCNVFTSSSVYCE